MYYVRIFNVSWREVNMPYVLDGMKYNTTFIHKPVFITTDYVVVTSK